MIVPPQRIKGDPDRRIECQEALEREFQALAQRAIGAGWSEPEIDFSLLCLSMSEIRRKSCNAETDRQIREAIRLVEGEL
ncbi:hypothetical protein NA8A_24109 [Nitratireductor indicus C115]|uniref:Uncharacterized protein n=1 Tax=Nitratireductor indicus C115 TaxID=1231190 RepID=K2NXI1_9HYPH|nr:hypothetical protein NA8A_24109 [Nitratireductor indicus C115]SFQ80055.1 hypothetical protein SAMN05216176_11760 [Nitratireductor indicus]